MSMTTNRYFAEVNSFHEQRVKDIKSSHQHFLQEQIKFYQKVVTYYTLCIMTMYIYYVISLQITEKLQETLRMYDQC